ncbi:MAG: hypothetical protein H7141_04440 [Burkholderiales bacterium]|nr:hypothetical protein [Bacteroidia bacterium]
MLSKKTAFFLLLIISLVSLVRAQDSTSKTKSSYFKASTSYLTNSVYGGRKDSLATPYITPVIGYYNKSGFFVEGSLSYLVATEDSRIDLFTLETGYDFTISDKLSGGIYGSKYFYNNSSTSVRSESKGGLGGSLTYDPGAIIFSGGLDLSFASKTDIFISGSLAHGFYFGDKGNEWSISPTVAVNLGTQNFYQDYIKNRKFKGGRRGRGGDKSGNSTVQTKSSNNFGVLDYELSLPITYDGNKWGTFFTPTYAIPQNPVSFASSTGSGYVTEKLENSFYAEFGVYIKF